MDELIEVSLSDVHRWIGSFLGLMDFWTGGQ